MNEQIHVGKIAAVFGLKGEVILVHVLGKKVQFKKGEAIFIEMMKGSLLPYFVEYSKARTSEETAIKLEGIDTKEKAKLVTGKQAWISQALFQSYAAKQAAISLLGFSIINEGKNLGKIEEVIEQPHQVLVTIKINGKEVMIPLHEESLIKIDRKKNEVIVELPEGLLDIYLNNE